MNESMCFSIPLIKWVIILLKQNNVLLKHELFNTIQLKLTKYFNSLLNKREKKLKHVKKILYSRFDNWIISNLKQSFLET